MIVHRHIPGCVSISDKVEYHVHISDLSELNNISWLVGKTLKVEKQSKSGQRLVMSDGWVVAIIHTEGPTCCKKCLEYFPYLCTFEMPR